MIHESWLIEKLSLRRIFALQSHCKPAISIDARGTFLSLVTHWWYGWFIRGLNIEWLTGWGSQSPDECWLIWHSARFRGRIVGLLPPQMRAGPSPLPRSWCCSYFWRHKIGLKLKIKYGWRQGTHGGIHSQLWADVFDTLLKLKHRRGLINGIPTDARVIIFGSDIWLKIILMSSIS